MVVLPAPLSPTMAVVLPAGMEKLARTRADRAAPGWVNVTSANRTLSRIPAKGSPLQGGPAARFVEHAEDGTHLRLELGESEQVTFQLAHVRLQPVEQSDAGERRCEGNAACLRDGDDQAQQDEITDLCRRMDQRVQPLQRRGGTRLRRGALEHRLVVRLQREGADGPHALQDDQRARRQAVVHLPRMGAEAAGAAGEQVSARDSAVAPAAATAVSRQERPSMKAPKTMIEQRLISTRVGDMQASAIDQEESRAGSAVRLVVPPESRRTGSPGSDGAGRCGPPR